MGKKLIVVQFGVALWEVDKGQLVPFENPLPDKTDFSWNWCDANHVVTARALYRDEGSGYRLVTSLKIINLWLITSASTWNELVAVTTYNKGLVLIDPKSGQTTHITRASGLPTLGTTCSFSDNQGRLWIGTDQGIVLAEPLRYGHRIASKDYPISAARSEGLLINYEDRAEYYHQDGREERLPRAYTLTSTQYGLALGAWNRTIVEGKEFPTPGNRVGTIAELPDGSLLAGMGERLSLLDPRSGTSQPLPSSPTEISSFAVVGGRLWGATIEGEILRSAPVPPFAFTKIAALPHATSATLHRLGETLIVGTSDGVRFGEQLRDVENTPGIRSPRLATTSDGTVWLLGEQAGKWRLGRLRDGGGTVAWETVEAKGLALLPDVHYLSASGTALMVCGGSSILELNTDELTPAYRLAAPRLEFSFQDPRTGTATDRAAPPAELGADANSLTFRGTLPFDEFGERPGFERRLLPTETAWVPTKAGEAVAYPSLSPRTYTLEVRATHLGHTGPVLSHAFTVLPPWYQSPLAFGGYAVFAGVFGFVTYRLRTHQIRRRNQELERIVEQRTRALAEASAAKTEFLASMSHEIRNPMNGVIGLVNILREQPGLPRQANTLRLLHGCAEQLRSTVDDILDFSKIEAGRVGLELSTFDLLDTLEAAAATVDPGGASVVFADKPPAGVTLRGDAGKLRQIFANYLTNALKYGIPPGARVSSILTPAGEGVRLTLSVSSTGPTIEKDKLDKLFESFARGNDAIERNIRGTGLGLAICKRYAEAMGGEVGAVSTNGETTFYLNVPFEKLSPAPLPALAAAVSTPHPTLPARALAIEDEDYNRIVLGDILAKMNYTVDWATTGAEALQLARENGYDIILTDYRLPDTNGVELTKKILQLCPVPKPAVFAVTAYSTRERRDECLAAGMSGFISKPITLEKLRATLFSWGDRQLTKISLEASVRPIKPTRRSAEIEDGWAELKQIAATDAKQAAGQAHRLNNLCRSLHQIDIAEQLELLEGALERGEPTGQLVAAIERLLRA
ncbi:MAG: response regulator [Verrucomicrobia bacterium]|nr:response regulator [Verrucomicrobiota bacterium]